MRMHLWEISGHANFYRENMFGTMDVENDEYQLKPMNCPGHILIYKARARSYRELPMRLAELGTVYRYERSGVMHGLLRVRGFTQDDAHIFCMKEQLESEVQACVEFAHTVLETFHQRPGECGALCRHHGRMDGGGSGAHQHADAHEHSV
jgi:threonyl-tRNA synthetase